MIILINSFYTSSMRVHTYSSLFFSSFFITGPLAKCRAPIDPKISRLPEFFVLFCRSVSNYSPPSKPIEFFGSTPPRSFLGIEKLGKGGRRRTFPVPAIDLGKLKRSVVLSVGGYVRMREHVCIALLIEYGSWSFYRAGAWIFFSPIYFLLFFFHVNLLIYAGKEDLT